MNLATPLVGDTTILYTIDSTHSPIDADSHNEEILCYVKHFMHLYAPTVWHYTFRKDCNSTEADAGKMEKRYCHRLLLLISIEGSICFCGSRLSIRQFLLRHSINSSFRFLNDDYYYCSGIF